MKPAFLVVALVLAAPLAVRAQAVEASVCDVVGHPAKYDGKVIRVKGTVQVGVDSFLMRGDSCSDALWLSYPAGTKAKAGPATVVTLQLAANATGTPGKARAAVTLERSKDFETFDNLLSQKVKLSGVCLGCVKNDVTATLTGRLDGTDSPGITRDAAGRITSLDGFGNLNGYGARLVIQSVSDVAAKPIDYATPKVADDNQGSGDKDYMGLARKASDAFPKGSDPVTKIDAALAAYGAPGVDNGVIVAFGDTANVPEGEGAKAAKSSPDGLLITTRFDPEKLKGTTLSLAIAHDGSVSEDLRANPTPSFSPVEQRAWQVVLLTTIGSRLKTLTLPGGAVLWNSTWTQPDQTDKASDALRHYLQDHEQTPR